MTFCSTFFDRYDSESSGSETGNKLIVGASSEDQQVEKASAGAQVTFYSTNFDKEVPESSDSEVGNKLVGDAIPQEQQVVDRESFMPENERNTGWGVSMGKCLPSLHL